MKRQHVVYMRYPDGGTVKLLGKTYTLEEARETVQDCFELALSELEDGLLWGGIEFEVWEYTTGLPGMAVESYGIEYDHDAPSMTLHGGPN